MRTGRAPMAARGSRSIGEAVAQNAAHCSREQLCTHRHIIPAFPVHLADNYFDMARATGTAAELDYVLAEIGRLDVSEYEADDIRMMLQSGLN